MQSAGPEQSGAGQAVAEPGAGPGATDKVLTQGPPARGTDAPTLRRELSWFGVLMLTLSCLSPAASVYGVGPDVLQHAGTGAAMVFLMGIGAALIWALVYAELGSAFPYSGGDYVGVGAILGPWAGFASLLVWSVTAGPSIASTARFSAEYLSALVPGSSPSLLTWPVLAAAVLMALLAVRTSALITGLFLAVEMLAVLLLIGVGFWQPVRSLSSALLHPVGLGSGASLVAVSWSALSIGAVSAAYATVGGNQALAFGEELAEPHRHMGRVVLLAGLIGAVTTALPVIGVVLAGDPLAALLRSQTPFSAFLATATGPRVGAAVSAAVALAIFNALIATLMFYGRLYFSIGRDAILHRAASRMLAQVHAGTGTPRVATLVVGAISALWCLADTHTLVVASQGLVTYTLALVCAAVWVGRRRGLTGQAGCWRSPLFPLAPLCGLMLALGFAVSDLTDPEAGRPSILGLGLVLVLGILWHNRVLQKRPGGWQPRLG